MNWKVTLLKHEDGAAMPLPVELLEKLDANLGDWIEFEKTERGYLMKKAREPQKKGG